MTQPGLTLRGVIDRVDHTKRTKDSYGQTKGGDLKITISVPRPEARPRPHWYTHQLDRAITDAVGLTRPFLDEDSEEYDEALYEDDDDDPADLSADQVEAVVAAVAALGDPSPRFTARLKEDATAAEKKEPTAAAIKKAWKAQQKNTTGKLQARVAELQTWETAAARHTVAFHQHIGAFALGAALEGESVTVTLVPDEAAMRQMLPGMSLLTWPS